LRYPAKRREDHSLIYSIEAPKNGCFREKLPSSAAPAGEGGQDVTDRPDLAVCRQRN
jgi:hypothetical protein